MKKRLLIVLILILLNIGVASAMTTSTSNYSISLYQSSGSLTSYETATYNVSLGSGQVTIGVLNTSSYSVQVGIYYIGNITFALLDLFEMLVEDFGIEWVTLNFSSTTDAELYYSTDNETWLALWNIDQTDDKGFQINLQEDTTYYFKGKNPETSYNYLAQKTNIGGIFKMDMFNLSVFLVFFGLGLILIYFMHKFKDDDVSVAYGFFATSIFVLISSMGFFGFEFVSLDGIILPFNINMMLSLICALAGIYAGWVSTALFRFKKEERNPPKNDFGVE